MIAGGSGRICVYRIRYDAPDYPTVRPEWSRVSYLYYLNGRKVGELTGWNLYIPGGTGDSGAWLDEFYDRYDGDYWVEERQEVVVNTNSEGLYTPSFPDQRAHHTLYFGETKIVETYSDRKNWSRVCMDLW